MFPGVFLDLILLYCLKQASTMLGHVPQRGLPNECSKKMLDTWILVFAEQTLENQTGLKEDVYSSLWFLRKVLPHQNISHT